MEFRQLRYFVAVAESLHFAKAALRLHITQPALSKQIQALEKDLEVQLFRRTKQQVELSEAGKVFLQHARQLLLQAQQAQEMTKRAARGEIGVLSIGFTPSARESLLPKIIQVFRSRFPNVELTMTGSDTERQAEALIKYQLDIAFLHPPIRQKNLHIHPLLEEEFLLVIPQNHPLQVYEKVPLISLAEESFILHPREDAPVLYDQFFSICHELGIQPRVVQKPLTHEARMALVASGIGVAFIPQSMQTFTGSGVICKVLEGAIPKLQLAAVWRQEELSPVLKEFIKVLLEISNCHQVDEKKNEQ